MTRADKGLQAEMRSRREEADDQCRRRRQLPRLCLSAVDLAKTVMMESIAVNTIFIVQLHRLFLLRSAAS
jgi:hypothetical protein